MGITKTAGVLRMAEIPETAETAGKAETVKIPGTARTMEKRKGVKRALGLCLAACMTVAGLAGCGTTDISLTTGTEEVELEVSWWGSDDRTSYTRQALREYEEENPAIRIHMTYGEFTGFELKNDVKMFSKNEADIMQINYSWIEKYLQQGLGFYDLSTLSEELDLSQYDETELSYGQADDGAQIALPIAINVEVVWYNKSLYDSYGLELPKTWDDLLAAAEVMGKDGVFPLDMDTTAIWQSMVAYIEQTTGHMVFDENNEFAFTEEDVRNMISFYLKLVDAHAVECVADRDETKLETGEYAGSMQWVSGAAKYEEMISGSGQEVQAALAPATANQQRQGYYVKPATLYAISPDSQNPEEAAKLLNYMVSDEYMVSLQKLEKGVPCNDKAVSILDESGELQGTQYDATLLAQETNYPLMSPYFEVTDYQNTLKSAIDQVMYGEASLEDAAAEAYAAMCAAK